MPAVTVDNVLSLEPISAAPSEIPARPVRRVSTAPTGYEGEGFPVRRAFAGVPHELLDPFIHMDQMGEVEYAPGEARGTSWHPHRGFETVTYMIDGTFEHQDSLGNGGTIRNGDTQWMTAGGGILHIEKPPEGLVLTGGLFHGVQLWVNLPRKDKFIPAAYQGIEGTDVTLARSTDGGALLRIVAGDVGAGERFTDDGRLFLGAAERCGGLAGKIAQRCETKGGHARLRLLRAGFVLVAAAVLALAVRDPLDRGPRDRHNAA